MWLKLNCGKFGVRIKVVRRWDWNWGCDDLGLVLGRIGWVGISVRERVGGGDSRRWGWIWAELALELELKLRVESGL